MLTSETQAVVKERRGLGIVIGGLSMAVIVGGFWMTIELIDQRIDGASQQILQLSTQNEKLMEKLNDVDFKLAELAKARAAAAATPTPAAAPPVAAPPVAAPPAAAHPAAAK